MKKNYKQYGGLNLNNVKESDFKYTRDPERIIWNKNLFPIGIYLVQAVKKIPWLEYEFNGKVNLFEQTEDGISVLSIEDTLLAKNTNGLPYYFFGGSVYEILNNVYRGANYPKLHSFVDPTGDLDIHLGLPTYLKTSKKTDYYQHIFNEQATLNEDGTLTNPLTYNSLVEHYTRWIMTNLERIFRTHLYQKLFENTVEFNHMENHEAREADHIIEIGNLKLVRLLSSNKSILKIQLVGKFEGMTISDHILEFVMPILTSIDDINSGFLKQNNKMNYELLQSSNNIFNNIPIEPIDKLIRGNEDSIGNRNILWNTPIRHKIYNHVGRMQYLNILLPKIVKLYNKNLPQEISNPILTYNDPGFSQNFGNSIIDLCLLLLDLKKEGKLCNLDYQNEEYECDERGVFDNIVKNLVIMLEYPEKSFNHITRTFVNKGKKAYHITHKTINGTYYSGDDIYTKLLGDLQFGGRRRKTRRMKKRGKKTMKK